MNKPNEFDDSHQPIEIPIPEHAPDPALPGELPDINALDKFVDSDEIVPQKEKSGKNSIIAPESGKSSIN